MEQKLEKLINKIQAQADLKKQAAVKDYEAGVADCKAGIYDKWYRYNRKDDGMAYDLGWREQNKTTENDNVIFLEVNKLF